MRRRVSVLGLLLCSLASLAGSATASAPDIGPHRRPPQEHPPAESAVFLRTVLTQIVQNQYARAWVTLHPVQKQAIALEEYVRCELASPVTVRMTSIRVDGVRPRRVVVPGGSAEAVPAQAVTFRLRIVGADGEASVISQTAHTVPVDGRWAWMLPAPRFELYRSGACLSLA